MDSTKRQWPFLPRCIEAEDDDEICCVTSVPSAVDLHQRGSDQQVTIRELESPLSTGATDDSSEKDD